MLKDFPSFLFTREKETQTLQNLDLTSSQNQYDRAENVAKLKYSYPVNIGYNDQENKPKCLTQMYLASDFLAELTPILPWNSANPVNTGYNLFHDFKRDEAEYYIADCRKTLASFFPSLFAGGSVGKCLYTENMWMTPLEFQNFSGSFCTDWKSAIYLRKPKETKNKRYNSKTIKSLIQDGILEVHPTMCPYTNSRENNNVQNENVDLLSTFFMNSGQELIMLHPNLCDQSILDITTYKCNMKEVESISDICLPHNKYNLSKKKSKHHVQSLEVKGLNEKIKQIHCQTFDECSEYFDSQKIAEGVREAHLTVNYADKKFQTYLLELNEDGYLNNQLLYDVNISDGDYLSDVTQSHLIQGETAYVLKKSGDVFLANEESHSIKLATMLQPTWLDSNDKNSSWRSIRFGSQPRQFIYSDHSQIISIDSRINTLNSNLNRNIYSAEKSNPIHRSQLCQNEYYTHLVCTANELILVDERFNVNNKPLLTWTHHLKSPATYLNNLYLTNSNNEYSHVVLCSDSTETFVYQFSLKTGTYVSHNFPRKLDSPKNLIEYLPDEYDKRLNRHLDYRLRKPALGMSTVKYKDSFALFQIQPNLDIFYECFKISDSEELNNEKIEKPKIIKNWLNSVKKNAMSELEISELEIELCNMNIKNKGSEKNNGPDFIQDYLPRALKNCGVCNEENFISGSIKKSSEVCPRCGLTIADSSRFMNADPKLQVENNSTNDNDFVGSLIDLGCIDLEYELTKELYSVWIDENQQLESSSEDLERIKRFKVSE